MNKSNKPVFLADLIRAKELKLASHRRHAAWMRVQKIKFRIPENRKNYQHLVEQIQTHPTTELVVLSALFHSLVTARAGSRPEESKRVTQIESMHKMLRVLDGISSLMKPTQSKGTEPCPDI